MTQGNGGEIQIGRVSERDGTRHHAIRDGHAACGRGKILLHHVVPLTLVTAKGACRTRACRKAIRVQLDAAQDALNLTASSPRRWMGERALDALRAAFATRTATARRDDLATRIRATMARSRELRNPSHFRIPLD